MFLRSVVVDEDANRHAQKSFLDNNIFAVHLWFSIQGGCTTMGSKLMSKIGRSLCVGGIVLLIGCTDEPLRAQKMFGPMSMHNWAEQDRATNVQDWHGMAQKIADGMQARGLLAAAPNMSSSPAYNAVVQRPFFVRSDQNTPFVRELGQALKTEIMQRGGLIAASDTRAQIIDVGVNVVSWGSRLNSNPDRLRTEAVWFASINSQNNMLMTIQEPFYIFDSDIPLYAQTIDPGQQITPIAHPLSYIR